MSHWPVTDWVTFLAALTAAVGSIASAIISITKANRNEQNNAVRHQETLATIASATTTPITLAVPPGDGR